MLILDSVTKLDATARGAVLIAASHCGLYAADAAAAAGVGGVVLNDAGIGLDRAGIAGLDHLDRLDLPAAAIDHRSARIGDGADCAARGIVSFVNRAAAALGVTPGMTARAAAARMELRAATATPAPTRETEVRSTIRIDGAVRPVHLLDSASLIAPGDAGAVVATGSHGGLLGGRPASAVKAPVFAALFNDAGVGADQAGISRLPALDARGIAAATVHALSARIGDGRSTYETGVISHLNDHAAHLGARPGISARDLVALLARHAIERFVP